MAVMNTNNKTMTNKKAMKQEETIQCRIQCDKYCYFTHFIIFVLCLFMFSCSNDIDTKIKDCYNSGDTIVNLYDLYPEEWDSVYYFSNVYAMHDIIKRIGSDAGHFYQDVGSRLYIMNNQGRIIYYKEWFVNYGQRIKGSIFVFNGDFDGGETDMIAIPRNNSKFIIRKRDEYTYWVIHEE